MKDIAIENTYPSADPASEHNRILRLYGFERLWSKLITLLSAVVPCGATADAWHAALHLLDNPIKLLSDPFFRLWLLRMMAHERKAEPSAEWASNFPNVLLAHLIADGAVGAISRLSYVTDAQGRIHASGFVVSTSWKSAICSLHWDKDRPYGALSDCQGNLLCGMRPLDICWHPRIGTDCFVDTEHPWLLERLLRMNALRARPPNPQHDVAPSCLPLHEICAIHQQALEVAWHWWPELAAEIEEDVRLISPFASEALNGWADVYLLGAIFVREEVTDLAFVLERLVHQAAHVRLFLISHGPLHKHPSDYLVPSPIRKDLRPVNGLFHAAFVNSRLIFLFGRTGDARYRSRRSQLVEQFYAAAQTLKVDCNLTGRGESLLASMIELVVKT